MYQPHPFYEEKYTKLMQKNLTVTVNSKLSCPYDLLKNFPTNVHLMLVYIKSLTQNMLIVCVIPTHIESAIILDSQTYFSWLKYISPHSRFANSLDEKPPPRTEL